MTKRTLYSGQNMAPTSIIQFEGASVRVVALNGEPWFIAADVCAALEIENATKAVKALDADEKTLTSIQGIHPGPGNPMVNAISESGFYKMVVRSRKATTSRRAHKMIDRTTPPGYRYPALYKTSAGICSPISKKATSDAASVFFVVCYTRHSMAWCAHLMTSPQAFDHATAHRAAPIMVTLTGQPQGWPVSFLPGTANPVNVTAPIKICSLGGDSLTSKKEAA
ncbi:ash family protein [Salmonella enterica]